ncbi:MAG: integration host factor subunit beta [Nitrospirae bacterium]|nr:integration host factor subunit beta [Nitrospirota bacterium]
MTKSRLVKMVAEKTPGLTKKQVEEIVNTIFDAMTKELAGGKGVEIRGLGNFRIRQRKERKARNPYKGITIDVPAKAAMHFKPSKSFFVLLNKERQ